MKLKCLDEYRTDVGGRMVVFEETHKFGYIHEVPDELGEELLATGKFAVASEAEIEAGTLEVLEFPSGPAPEPPDEPAASTRPSRRHTEPASAAEPAPAAEPEPDTE
ncbi:hypothetical protein LCGC14_2183840 [marine sediment metagenome]|uniref:Uncharacterized protein n=1 Tax=marine sediment metagenome TaxID=412755 RepID=A0A0F9DLH2_9ZZZZ|nr:hypothetical protein [bacterium]